jgi:hypothetical protein
LGTPKSKIVSEVLMCFFRKSNVMLNRLLGYVFSYILTVYSLMFIVYGSAKLTINH